MPLRLSWRSAGFLLLAGDLITASLLYQIVHFLRLGVYVNLAAVPFLIVFSTLVLMLFLFDTYRVETPVTRSRLPLTAAFASLLAIITSSSLVYFYGPLNFESTFGRGIMPVVLVLFSVWAYWSRYALSLWSESRQKVGKWIYIGHDDRLDYLMSDFAIDRNDMIILDEPSDGGYEGDHVSGKGINERLCHLTQQDVKMIRGVIIATEHVFNDKAISVLMKLRSMGANLYDFTAFYEQNLSKVPVLHLKHGWFINSSGFYLLQNAFGIKFKRLMDVVMSIVLLVLLSPVLFLVSLVVRLDSKGPSIYSQKRTGLNGSDFMVHKFRTMREDAEKDGAVWAQENDKRITRVGQILRKSRLDELPQLWNVLIGEMSFIGPRPERPEFIVDLEKNIPFYELRHLVKPGISGWAQVMYPYGASVEDARHKLEYDLFYIKNYSLLLDFAIIMKTLRLMIWHKGR